MLADKKVNAEKKTEIKNIMPLVSIKVDLHSVLNGLNHEDSAIK